MRMNVSSIASQLKPDMLQSRIAMLKLSQAANDAKQKVIEQAMNVYLPETVDGEGSVEVQA